MPGTQKAPGLTWRKRRNGPPIAYWVARRDLVKKGFRPKAVRLHYEADDPAMAARCNTLQAEMLEWSVTNRMARPTDYDGTFASLVKMYETDRDSSYFEIKPGTQRTYSKTLKALMLNKGDLRIDMTTASDIRRWYKELAEAVSKSWAYYTINVLKVALSYGSTKRITECTLLRGELRDARFKSSGRRHEQLTYEQSVAFCRSANALGYPWMARCLRIQFDFGMRRIDVIGEWVTDETAEGGIRIGKRVHVGGLTWQHIDEQGICRKLISKTQFTTALVAVHAVADYPEVEADLARTPVEERIGPVVINDRTGLPPTDEQCRKYFRVIAKRAGISPDIKMMHARAGANTEAYEAGATEEEAMALLTHTERKTNRGYLRDLTQQSRSAAHKRVASRKK